MTPGHTMAHICLTGEEAGRPFALVGDTIFGAGVGNCSYGGHAPTLFRTVGRLMELPDETLLYPGHDYLARNLAFTVAHEPGNEAAHRLLSELGTGADRPLRLTTIGEERTINSFMRLGSQDLRSSVLADEAQATDPLSDEDMFLRLRALRDAWS